MPYKDIEKRKANRRKYYASSKGKLKMREHRLKNQKKRLLLGLPAENKRPIQQQFARLIYKQLDYLYKKD